MLASTDPQAALRRTAAEQPEAYALALALREHYSGWLRDAAARNRHRHRGSGTIASVCSCCRPSSRARPTVPSSQRRALPGGRDRIRAERPAGGRALVAKDASGRRRQLRCRVSRGAGGVAAAGAGTCCRNCACARRRASTLAGFLGATAPAIWPCRRPLLTPERLFSSRAPRVTIAGLNGGVSCEPRSRWLSRSSCVPRRQARRRHRLSTSMPAHRPNGWGPCTSRRPVRDRRSPPTFDRAVALLHSFWFRAAVEAFTDGDREGPRLWDGLLGHRAQPVGQPLWRLPLAAGAGGRPRGRRRRAWRRPAVSPGAGIS